MLPAFVLFEEPSPGAADGDAVIFKVIIVEDMKILKAVDSAKFVEFLHCAPPIIVITLHNNFSAIEFIQKFKISQ